SSTAAAEISQSRSILSDSKTPIAALRVAAAAHLAFPAMRLPASFESEVCNGGNARVKRAPPPGLSATLTLPRCARLISRTLASRRPAPSFFPPPPRQNRLKMFSRSFRGTPQPRSATSIRPAVDRDGHFRSRRGVNDRVLNQISQRIFERVSVCFYVD